MSVQLSELVLALGRVPNAAWENIRIEDIAEDSRRVAPGSLFVAIPGAEQDGHDHIGDAVTRGAAAVIAEREIPAAVPLLVVESARMSLAQLAAAFYELPTRELTTIGVTGTNGKTTVCHLIAHLLGEDRTTLVSTTTNAAWGVRGLTTPSSLVVQRIAREAVSEGRDWLVLEASSVGLAQHRLAAVDFDVAVFTNLTADHLDLHTDLDKYLLAKKALFSSLKPTAWAVVNVDDPASDEILSASSGRAFPVSARGPAELTAFDIVLGAAGSTLALQYRGTRATVKLPRFGLHYVENALAAAGAALCLGLPLDVIAQRLGTAPRVPGRQIVFRNAVGTTAVVDFAHNPDGLRRMLEALRDRFSRVICVFGSPGGGTQAKRHEMGRISGQLADLTVLTTDNPKHESPGRILDEIEGGVASVGAGAKRIFDREAAIRFAAGQASPSDVILLAGKGHETYQIVGDEFVPHCDADILLELGFHDVE